MFMQQRMHQASLLGNVMSVYVKDSDRSIQPASGNLVVGGNIQTDNFITIQCPSRPNAAR
jgi:hypothetical protein